MEEKKKGYATQEQQTAATKRYRQTEEGKRKTARTNCKSKGKKFINEFATLEELQEWQEMIKEKILELQENSKK